MGESEIRRLTMYYGDMVQGGRNGGSWLVLSCVEVQREMGVLKKNGTAEGCTWPESNGRPILYCLPG
jgi:hypothetical protein